LCVLFLIKKRELKKAAMGLTPVSFNSTKLCHHIVNFEVIKNKENVISTRENDLNLRLRDAFTCPKL